MCTPVSIQARPLPFFKEDKQQRCVFVAESDDQSAINASEIIILPSEWNDTVVSELSRLNAYTGGGGISLDGISYRLDSYTYEASCSIRFGNPRMPEYRSPERAMVRTVRELADASSSALIRGYLEIWEKYVGNRMLSDSI